ncbi:efflux RND transporter periplasmic adaptor subunit [Hyphomicrobium sp.]|uniref:HlyD family secretion protein n=1 Tax=Hyphomicrobium sp. TaxID=82 RepID=UPI0025BF02BD|nr:efflux RND transporter periplasmic adaptor subunit [Hyphomicrobium sp.]
MLYAGYLYRKIADKTRRRALAVCRRNRALGTICVTGGMLAPCGLAESNLGWRANTARDLLCGMCTKAIIRAAGRDLPFSLADVENRRTTYLAAEGALQEVIAKTEQARVAYESQIGGVHTSVARLRADLRDAEFDLDMTTVRAPGPGFVTQLALRPGMYVIPAPLRPVMVFVHDDDRTLAAGFQQNALQRVLPGDEAEVAFDAVPGRVFKGKVVRVLDAIAPGQWIHAGYGRARRGGRAVAVIELDEDTSMYNIPGGAAAQVALYTPFWHHFAIIRKILMRMRSWENYVFLEGH